MQISYCHEGAFSEPACFLCDFVFDENPLAAPRIHFEKNSFWLNSPKTTFCSTLPENIHRHVYLVLCWVVTLKGITVDNF